MPMIPIPPGTDIERMIKQLVGKEDDDGPTLNAYDASVMLKNYDYNIKCPFKVGQFITPTKQSSLKGRGEPHHVIQVFDVTQVQLFRIGEPLMVYNMLITQVIHDKSVYIWAALSSDYELFKGLTCNEISEAELNASNM